MREWRPFFILIGVVVGGPIIYGFLTYGTFRPCEMARFEVKRAAFRAAAAEHGTATATMGMALYGASAIDSIVEMATVWRCVDIVIKAHTGVLDSELAKAYGP